MYGNDDNVHRSEKLLVPPVSSGIVALTERGMLFSATLLDPANRRLVGKVPAPEVDGKGCLLVSQDSQSYASMLRWWSRNAISARW